MPIYNVYFSQSTHKLYFNSLYPRMLIYNLHFFQSVKLLFQLLIPTKIFQSTDFDKLCIIWWNLTKIIMLKLYAYRKKVILTPTILFIMLIQMSIWLENDYLFKFHYKSIICQNQLIKKLFVGIKSWSKS